MAPTPSRRCCLSSVTHTGVLGLARPARVCTVTLSPHVGPGGVASCAGWWGAGTGRERGRMSQSAGSSWLASMGRWLSFQGWCPHRQGLIFLICNTGQRGRGQGGVLRCHRGAGLKVPTQTWGSRKSSRPSEGPQRPPAAGCRGWSDGGLRPGHGHLVCVGGAGGSECASRHEALFLQEASRQSSAP